MVLYLFNPSDEPSPLSPSSSFSIKSTGIVTVANSALGRPFHRRSSHWRDFTECGPAALSWRVTRKHGCAYTRTLCTKVICRLLHLSLSLFLSLLFSASLVCSEWTMDGIAHQPARSWFSCSLGVTCPRRISTVTFYRFLRSPPSTFTVKTADFQQRALSRGTYCVPCKTSVDSRRIETKFRESVCESRLCTNMCASHLCFTGSVCLACWWPINVWTY